METDAGFLAAVEEAKKGSCPVHQDHGAALASLLSIETAAQVADQQDR